jgi:uncharacterized damage-inducible protein DinB
MMDHDDIGRLLDYTVWANRRVLRAAATLTTEQFTRDLGSSHGGVRGTLTHMMSAEWIWVERFKGLAPRPMMDEGQFGDVMALRERWQAVETHRADWLRSLRPGAASAPVRYQNTGGQAFEAPLWQLVQHLANHSSYHRGQVAALLRQLGAQVPSTDLVAWDRRRGDESPAG